VTTWPITITGEIYPAHGIPSQWEIGHCQRSEISQLPLNPYTVTCGTPNQPRPGITIICIHTNSSVVGQFHRKPDNKSIWLYTDWSNGGLLATNNWYSFLFTSFGIVKGQSHVKIPVYLDFYPNLKVEIR